MSDKRRFDGCKKRNETDSLTKISNDSRSKSVNERSEQEER